MKKIERLNNVYSQEQLLNFGMISRTVNALIDAHNELLDTHTVKVKEEHLCLNGVVGTTCNNPECQPTTPEKKCCEKCQKCPDYGDNHKGYCHYEDCQCHQENLPTSSYEVTCGRCEKSIKHSCGL